MAKYHAGLQVYADLMNEARIRLEAVRTAMDARENWAPRLFQEFIYLQFRMLCEVIAVGCLVAYGDITRRDALKTWKIPHILKRLEEIGPDFYPQGIRISHADKRVHAKPRELPQLSKSDLLKLWTGTGRHLHRGSAQELLAERRKDFCVDLTELSGFYNKILNLLDQHLIPWPDEKHFLVVALIGKGGQSELLPIRATEILSGPSR